jgi:hypothetical protein
MRAADPPKVVVHGVKGEAVNREFERWAQRHIPRAR